MLDCGMEEGGVFHPSADYCCNVEWGLGDWRVANRVLVGPCAGDCEDEKDVDPRPEDKDKDTQVRIVAVSAGESRVRGQGAGEARNL